MTELEAQTSELYRIKLLYDYGYSVASLFNDEVLLIIYILYSNKTLNELLSLS